MDAEPREVFCRFCSACNGLNRVFCVACKRRLAPPSPYCLSVEDFESDADRSNLDALKGTEPLPQIAETLTQTGTRDLESWLAKYGLRVSFPSRLDTLVRGLAELMGLDRLPRVYVAPGARANAFAAGRDEDPLLVIYSPVFETLDYAGLEALLAHELAHIRSKHVLYHNLAESVANGVQMASTFLPVGVLTVPFRMLLLSWYRESELSADRASLIVLGRYEEFEATLARLTNENETGDGDVSEGGSVTELLQTHPSTSRRLSLAKEFTGTEEYIMGKAKIRAAALSSSVMSLCSYCEFVSPTAEVFCPSCQISRQ